MKDVVTATGVPKSTIILYVNNGLLPQPVRTQPNMAYYHPSCVERVAFIKQTQARSPVAPDRLSRACSKRWTMAGTWAPLLELQASLFGSRGKQNRTGPPFTKATGLSADTGAKPYATARILIPMADNRFDAEDQAMGQTD